MSLKPDPDGMPQLLPQVAAKIEQVDAAIRSEYAGRPLDEIIDLAASAFNSMGVELMPESIRDYAMSVSLQQPFRLICNDRQSPRRVSSRHPSWQLTGRAGYRRHP